METYLDLKNALKGTGLTKTSEYKDYARKMNDEAGKTVYPVSPDLKFKKDGTWVSFADLLSLSMDGFVAEEVVETKVETKNAWKATDNELNSVTVAYGENISPKIDCDNPSGEIFDNTGEVNVVLKPRVTDITVGLNVKVEDIIIGNDGSLGVKTTEWTYEELSNYVAGKFAKLSDYKDYARNENKNKILHRDKKLPVSPDIYFKDRGIVWNGANDFLQIGTESGELSPKTNKNLLKGIEQMNAVLDDSVPKDAKEKSIVVPKYDIDETINDNKLTNNVAGAIMRLSDHVFTEIDIKSLPVKQDKFSSAYTSLEKISYCQTQRKNYTNVTFYDKISGTVKHVKANLLINKQEKELSVLFYNPENPEVDFTEKEIKDIITKIVTTKSIMDKDKKPLSIYRTLAILEKQKVTISLFFMESNYQCFFDKDLELKID